MVESITTRAACNVKMIDLIIRAARSAQRRFGELIILCRTVRSVAVLLSLLFEAELLIGCSSSVRNSSCQIGNAYYSLSSLQSSADSVLLWPNALIDVAENAKACSLEDPQNESAFLAVAAEAYARVADDYQFMRAAEGASLARDDSQRAALAALRDKRLDSATRRRLLRILNEFR